MSLPGSGTISFSQIQSEFGGSNPISMSEYYGVGGVPGSGTISMSDFHGASAGPIWSTTMTVGSIIIPAESYYAYGCIPGSMGSFSDGTFDPKSGASISSFFWEQTSQVLSFQLGGIHTNAGWTYVDIASSANRFYRSSATYSSGGGGTSWYWSSTWPGIGTSGVRTLTFY